MQESRQAELPAASEASNTLCGDVEAMDQIPYTSNFDADVKATTTTRADNTMHVSYQTGESVVMWPDGSRTTNWGDGTWVVEIPGLPCVRGSLDKVSCEVAVDAQLVWHKNSDSISLVQQGACGVFASPDGGFTACEVPPD